MENRRKSKEIKDNRKNCRNQRKSKKIEEIQKENQRKSKNIEKNPKNSKKIQEDQKVNSKAGLSFDKHFNQPGHSFAHDARFILIEQRRNHHHLGRLDPEHWPCTD